MIKHIFVFLVMGFWLSGCPVLAGQNFNSSSSAPAKASVTPVSGGGIVTALKLAEKGQWSEARRIARNLPEAERYTFRWKEYRDGAPGIDFQDISAFIRARNDWPLMDIIRLEAEKVIPQNLPAQQIVDWFSANSPQTAKGMRLYVQALTKSGQGSDLEKLLNSWWEDADLTRDQQRQFYADYGRYLDKASHKKRLDTLLDRGDYSQAYGIADVLGAGYTALTQARVALANGEGNVNGYLNNVPPQLQNDEGLLYERLRWRRRNDMDSGAIEILSQEPPYGAKHDPAGWWQERQIIARRLLEKKNYKQAYQIARNHRQKEGLPFAEAEWLSGWLALERLNKSWEAFEHFERMYHKVETPISRARGAYWAGRASERLGHREIAEKWYRAGAQETGTFYGQMAAAALGLEPSLPRSFSQSSQTSLTSMSGLVQSAKWFDQAGIRSDTSAFLYRMGKLSETPEQFSAAADLAEKMGFRHVAIKIAQDAQANHGVLLQESAYPSLTQYLGGVKDVEWALIHALIRQESRFDHQAVSSAGARGLMQVMPATAKQVAGKMGISHQTDWLIARPDHNIKLGSRYIAQMLDRYGNNYAMALAAYNAGPGRVDKWINIYGDPRKGQIDLIDWIESIPFTETRNYVQRVMEGAYVYRLLLQGKQRECTIPLHVAEIKKEQSVPKKN